MNKAELITAIAEKTGYTKIESEKTLNAFLAVVGETLTAGEKIQLTGFGTFEVRRRAERKGRNPRNPEEEITIPATLSPVFKAGKGLKEQVNK